MAKGVGSDGGGHEEGWPTVPEGWPGNPMGWLLFCQGVARGVAKGMGVAKGVELGLGSVLGQIDFPIPFLGNGVPFLGNGVGGGHNFQRGGQLK